MRKLTPALLRQMPLPRLSADSDKSDRGIVLAIGGSASSPGAILLAGLAALRAGAGKLQLGVSREIAIALGVALPEALVASGRAIDQYVEQADAILIGPGMAPRVSTVRATRRYYKMMKPDAVLVLDASALPAAGGRSNAIITPHVGEMAKLMDVDEADVATNASDIAVEASAKYGCVVALKSDTTYIAGGGDVFQFDGGTVGLATSGSGDTLAGIVAGLAARGADPLTAALWAVWAHGIAGRRLSQRIGRTGFLARELLDELPKLLSRSHD